MQNELYFIILKELTKNGLGFKADISKFISQYFPEEPMERYWDQPSANMVAYLKDMKENGHIFYDVILLDAKPNTLIRETQVTASITDKGLDYLKKHEKLVFSKWWKKIPHLLKTIAAIISISTGIILIYQFIINRHNESPPKKLLLKTKEKKTSHNQIPSARSTPKPFPSDSSRKP
jgi:hypothetical protein